ncbi:MAG: ECF transporter S component [Candidatus Methanofastidiosa archaeon]|nr:ECF transporter S component [Candidatus Methanofastidiosa archaeon]
MRMQGQEIALVGIMASLIVASGYVPIIPIFGTGYTISLGSVLIMVVAILLGPVLGTLTVLVGSFAGMILTGQGIQLLFFIPATIGALTAALLAWGRAREAIAIMALAILIWYSSPLGLELWYYPYLHIATLLAVIVTRPFIKPQGHREFKYGYPLIALFCMAGVLCDHLLGSTIAMFPPFELPSEAYRFILFIYPIERALICVVAATVAFPVIRALRSSSLPILGCNEDAVPDPP